MIEAQAYARAGLIGNPSDGFYGKTISSIGWVLEAFAAILIIISFTQGKVGILQFAGAILIAAMGIVIVSWGQLLSCFVSIERNTKATYKTVEKLLSSK